MNEKIKAYLEIADQFAKHGYNLWLVGGTVRDYLLGKELTDMDAVTDALPNEVVAFLDDVDTTFIRFGSLKYKNKGGIKFDITTLRKEASYEDSRHPEQIEFVKDLKSDYLRRDFTVNALYMDKDLHVIDYCDGQKDLNERILRMVGDPYLRTKEDPLRILRAIRFHLMHHLKIDDSLLNAMHDNFPLLKNITDAKIKSELNKIDDQVVDIKEKTTIFAQFDIANLVGVIK